MSGFAALGCNPNARWTVDLTNPAQPKIEGDNPGSATALGTLAYSPDGGMFLCVQADGAIAEGDLCQIENGFQIDQATTASPLGSIIGVATAVFANNEYGWLQVFGKSRVQVNSGSNHAASIRVSIGDDGEIANASTDVDTVAGITTSASSGSDGRLTDCFLFFPKKVS